MLGLYVHWSPEFPFGFYASQKLISKWTTVSDMQCCWQSESPFSFTNLALIFCGFSAWLNECPSIVVVWRGRTVGVNCWAWLVIASSFIKSAETVRVRTTWWLFMVRGEEELVELLIMSLDSRAHVPASSSDTTKPFPLFHISSLSTLYKLGNKNCHFKVKVLIVLFWDIVCLELQHMRGARLLILPSWNCLRFPLCFSLISQEFPVANWKLAGYIWPHSNHSSIVTALYTVLLSVTAVTIGKLIVQWICNFLEIKCFSFLFHRLYCAPVLYEMW